MPEPKRFVYILKSIPNPAGFYVGVTSDIRARLVPHNQGLSPYTASHRPWKPLVVIEFEEEEPALRFDVTRMRKT
jgi:putative endonuclease